MAIWFVGIDFFGSSPLWQCTIFAEAFLLEAKTACKEHTSRYLARDLGPENIRANLIAAGPIRTMAAKSIPGFEEFEKVWNERSPLQWDVTDPVPAAQTSVALLSDWFPKTTAEIIHVDGGLHAMGA